MDSNYQNDTHSETKVVGVVFGRFQPFHLSHMAALKRCSEKVDEMIVLVSDLPLLRYGHSPKMLSRAENPFDYKDRKEMIERALVDEAGIMEDKFSVHPFLKYLFDMHRRDADQNIYIIADHGKLSKYLKAAFRSKGRKASTYGNGAETGVHATEIRALIRAGREWEGLVPKSTADVVHTKIGVRA